MRNDFESAVAFLLSHDPVKKKRGAKRTSAQISATTASNSKDKISNDGKNVTFKPSYGKTGVNLRYYKLKEWKKLTKEQHQEVMKHRKKNGDYPNSWSKKGGRNS